MIDSGMCARVYAPYGSCHDGTVFQIGLCDKCVVIAKPTPIGDYICPDFDAKIKSSLNYYEEDASND